MPDGEAGLRLETRQSKASPPLQGGGRRKRSGEMTYEIMTSKIIRLTEAFAA